MAEWQTRYFEGVVIAGSCEFKSHQPHQMDAGSRFLLRECRQVSEKQNIRFGLFCFFRICKYDAMRRRRFPAAGCGGGGGMRNIWITLMYDGSSFAGFQRQENGLAVQEVVEQVLERVTGKKTTLYFVARTDAGVHAWAQECTFFTESSIPGEKFKWALNAYLPLTVRVRESREAAEDFSVRKENTGKTYGYLLSPEREVSPFLRRYVWASGKRPDTERMRTAAAALCGTHDFTSFRGNNSVPADPRRTIYDISIREEAGLFRIYVTGDGFLYHMVRNIAGALLDAGCGKLTAGGIREILAARDRRRLGVTAPAAGLALLKVYFEPVTEDAVERTLREPLWPWNG